MDTFELIIFDCDGVLVDSERIANEVFAGILKESCGLTLNQAEMFELFVGRSAKQCIQTLTDLLGHPPPADIQHRYEQDINIALRTSVTAVAGIREVLEGLQLPYCVASGGSYAKMHITLGKTGLLPLLEGRLFSTSDVHEGKPRPDIFLHAAARMGVTNPAKCLVIEDSPPGIQGGIHAGMTVFGYAECMNPQTLREAGAHLIFNDMRQLLRLNNGRWPDSIFTDKQR